VTNEGNFYQEKSFIYQKITKKQIYENNFQLSTFNFQEWTNKLPINLEIGFLNINSYLFFQVQVVEIG
jgi:hypothetical protein